MSLKLYFHPLSSFCQKALIAFYENDTPFEPHIVDLADAKSSAAFKAIWPIGKFPVLRDEANDRTVPEFEHHHRVSGAALSRQIAARAGRSRVRLPDASQDRFYDLYVNVPMQKIVTDKLRPPGKNDPHGVEEAKRLLQTACGLIEREMAARTWAMGDDFSMADCAAAPALFYANMVTPLGDTYPSAAAYLGRLMDRPSYARALKEAKPYLALVPK